MYSYSLLSPAIMRLFVITALVTLSPEWLSAISTAAIVVLTLFYVIVSGRTLKQIGKQGNDTAKAADAAQKSANALMNSERAWVMVDIEWTPGYPTRMRAVTERDVRTALSVRLTCRNEGKTPAWITQKKACIQVVKELPAIPDFSSMDVIQTEPEPLGVVRSLGKARDFALTGDGWQSGTEDDGTMTVIYGIITYRDAFSDSRTTTFGWRITLGNEFETLGFYPEYNKNT
jgi:hypothetical protein